MSISLVNPALEKVCELPLTPRTQLATEVQRGGVRELLEKSFVWQEDGEAESLRGRKPGGCWMFLVAVNAAGTAASGKGRKKPFVF